MEGKHADSESHKECEAAVALVKPDRGLPILTSKPKQTQNPDYHSTGHLS